MINAEILKMKCSIPNCNKKGIFRLIFGEIELIYCKTHKKICDDTHKRINHCLKPLSSL